MNTKKITTILWFLGILMTWAQNDTIAIEHVNIIPMHKEIVLENYRVVIAKGKILTVERADKKPGYMPSLVIDGSDKYLIPGLSEMHYHWRNKEGGIERDFNLMIANGVTTVRNMAEYDWQDHIGIRDSIQKGIKFGPNYHSTGPYLNSGNLRTVEEVDSVVLAHKEKNYDFLKLADNLPKDIYLRLLEESQRLDVPVIGHAQRELPLEYSLRMKSIEHVEEFVYLFKEAQRTDHEFLKNTVEEIKNSGITITPTLVVFDMIVKSLDDHLFLKMQHKKEAKYMLSGDYNYWSSKENPYRKDLKDKVINGKDALPLLKGYFDWMKRFTKILADADVPLMTGSDTFGFVIPGYSLHEEFQYMNACGLSPFEVLKASTITPARYLNTLATEGTVSEGKNANLVLLAKNPLEDIKNTKAIVGVILRGKWFDRNQLDSLLNEVNALNHNK